jgi:hypothetical protein
LNEWTCAAGLGRRDGRAIGRSEGGGRNRRVWMGVLYANREMSDCSLGWRDVVVRISRRRCWKRGALDGVGKVSGQ